MSQRFDILDTPLAGLKLLQRKPLSDSRGYFERLYCVEEIGELLRGKSIRQINHSFTARSGSVRGLHYQRSPHAEIKLVSCIRGAVFDVVVDLRHDSSSYLHWHGEVLTSGNHHSLLIPEGFAHGFQTLVDDVEMLYFHTHDYTPSAESGINVGDPSLSIQWPEAITDLSGRDAALPCLPSDFPGLSS